MSLANILEDKKNIYFIGIGGSGMYPLAQILFAMGYNISGSDVNETETIEAIRKMGINVNLKQVASNIKGADLVIYTPAIMKENPEFAESQKLNLPMLERSELLGIVSTWHKNSISVSGVHGKTSTTSMVGQILLTAGLDPTCAIGGKLPSIDGNGRLGKSEYMVCEACEFLDSFLKINTSIAVVITVDEDHLDYFKTLDNIINSFSKFCNNATDAVIINGDEDNTKRVISQINNKKVITFGFEEYNHYYATDIVYNGIDTTFSLMSRNEKISTIFLKVPGKHNVMNALAAITTCLYMGLNIEQVKEGLKEFKGAARRFEFIDVVDGVTIVDDYAHHPTEVESMLQTAMSLGYKKVWAVHQPFTYSRTFRHKEDFAKALSIADKVILAEIMGSREKNTYNISSQDLANMIPDSLFINTFDEITAYLCNNVEKGDLVITFGGGDIYKVSRMLSSRLRDK